MLLTNHPYFLSYLLLKEVIYCVTDQPSIRQKSSSQFLLFWGQWLVGTGQRYMIYVTHFALKKAMSCSSSSSLSCSMKIEQKNCKEKILQLQSMSFTINVLISDLLSRILVYLVWPWCSISAIWKWQSWVQKNGSRLLNMTSNTLLFWVDQYNSWLSGEGMSSCRYLLWNWKWSQ